MLKTDMILHVSSQAQACSQEAYGLEITRHREGLGFLWTAVTIPLRKWSHRQKAKLTVLGTAKCTADHIFLQFSDIVILW
ncbi:hypothetical protein C1H46_020139 [Malus baccata]|uniref:Uncharacterized protein n=1 Tax=Malus baccata TaxID=106549 RepID=A0A540M6J7_MALBA|nr:hypothetical protein C1H46_020139 [Malus baccata]